MDEIGVDNQFTEMESKNKRRMELFKIIDNLNNSITDYFYLKEAQEFWHSNY